MTSNEPRLLPVRPEIRPAGATVRLAVVPNGARPPAEPTAEQRMCAYYVTERTKGRTPTGAELDRIAGTNNYGRKVLRRWRQSGHLPPALGGPRGERPARREPAYAASERVVV